LIRHNWTATLFVRVRGDAIRRTMKRPPPLVPEDAWLPHIRVIVALLASYVLDADGAALLAKFPHEAKTFRLNFKPKGRRRGH
jgi:hypothetical protein